MLKNVNNYEFYSYFIMIAIYLLSRQATFRVQNM